MPGLIRSASTGLVLGLPLALALWAAILFLIIRN